MKPLLLAVFLSGMLSLGLAEEPKRAPANLIMTLAEIADAGEPRQYLFVIDGVLAYTTVNGLKKALKNFPTGSRLTWDPGCSLTGEEPLLSSEKAMKDFTDYCASIGIEFVLVPSG